MQRHFLKDFNDFGGIYVTKEHGKKKNRLEGIARFIVEKRKAIYLIYILLADFLLLLRRMGFGRQHADGLSGG